MTEPWWKPFVDCGMIAENEVKYLYTEELINQIEAALRKEQRKENNG